MSTSITFSFLFWLTWRTGTTKINSCNICQCIDTIFSSENYSFFFHNLLISNDFTVFLFKDLKYFAMCDMIIFRINNNFFYFLLLHNIFQAYLFRIMLVKGNAQFVQKLTFEPLMDFKQNHYGSWEYNKSFYQEYYRALPATFQSFLHLNHKAHNYFFYDCTF